MITLKERLKRAEAEFGMDDRYTQMLRDKLANQQYSAGAQQMYITGSVGPHPKTAKD